MLERAPKDHATGLATGKRMHKPFVITAADVDGDGSVDLTVQLDITDVAPRDAASGQASGKRAGKAKYKNIVLRRIADSDGDGLDDYSGDPADIEALRSYSAGHFELDVDQGGTDNGRVGAGPHVVKPRRGVIFGGDRILPAVQAGQSGPIKWMSPESLAKHGSGGGGGAGDEAAADGSVRVATGDVNGDGIDDVTLNFTRDGQGGVVIVLDGVGDLDGDGKMDFAPHGGDSDGPKVDSILIGLLLPAVQKGKPGSVRGREAGSGAGGTDTGFNQTHNQEGKGRQNGLAAGDGGSGSPAGIAIDEGGTPKVHHKPGLIQTGDVNGDGSPDFVISGADTSFLLRAGDKAWPVRYEGPRMDSQSGGDRKAGAADGSVRVAVGDVNGDGRADLTLNFSKPGSDGSLLPAVQYVLVAGADVDGDGIADFNFSGSQGDANAVNALIGLLLPAVQKIDDAGGSSDKITGAGMGMGPLVKRGDVNGDGKPDVIVSGVDAEAMRKAGGDPHVSGGIRVSPADINGDGKADLTFDFKPTPEQARKGLNAVNVKLARVADMDGDGTPDFMLVGGPSNEGSLNILIGLLLPAVQKIDDAGGTTDRGIITSAGAGGGPHVKRGDVVVSGQTVKLLVRATDAAGNTGADRQRADEYVRNYGFRVEMADASGDGVDDVKLNFTLPKPGETAPPSNGKFDGPSYDITLTGVGDVDGDGVPDFSGSPKDVDNVSILIGLLLPSVPKPSQEPGGRNRTITGAGAGGGPHVKVVDSDIITGAGAGGGPHVKRGDAVISGRDLQPLRKAGGDAIIWLSPSSMAKYSAGGGGGAGKAPAADGSVRVAAGDVNGDGIEDVTLNFTRKAGGGSSFKLLGVGDIDQDGLPDFVLGSGGSADELNAILIGLLLPAVQKIDDAGGTTDRGIITSAGAGGGPHVKRGEPISGKAVTFVVHATDAAGNTGADRTAGGGGGAGGQASREDQYAKATGLAVAAADVDGDGLSDVVITFTPPPAGQTAPPASGRFEGKPVSITLLATGDLDGDGTPDFVAGDKPTAAQFQALIDSLLNKSDDRNLLGLKNYDPTKQYQLGDSSIFNGRELKRYFEDGDIPNQSDQDKSSHGTGGGGGAGKSFTWTVDTTPPDVTAARGPRQSVSYTWTVDTSGPDVMSTIGSATGGAGSGKMTLNFTRSDDNAQHHVTFVSAGDLDGDGVNELKLADGDSSDFGILIGLLRTASSHEVMSPRDHASGLPTGKRQYDPVTVKSDPGFLSGAEWTQIQAQDKVQTAREPQSGMATGRRQYNPIKIQFSGQDNDSLNDLALTLTYDEDAGITSPRDHASGLPTGKRMHKPIFYGIGDVDGDGSPDFLGSPEDLAELRYYVSDVKGPRDASTGQASGRAGTGGPHVQVFTGYDIEQLLLKGGKPTSGQIKVPGGTTDPTPASYTWTVDLTPPDVRSAGGGGVTIHFKRSDETNEHKVELVQTGDLDGDGKPDYNGTGDVDELGILIGLLRNGGKQPVDGGGHQPVDGGGHVGGSHDTFFGYSGKVEVTNDKGTSYLTPDTTIDVGPGGAPGAPGTSSPDAEKFLKDIEDPALFDQADAAAAAIKANLAPIRQRLQRIDRDLKQIETEWPKYERTHDLGRLIILWSEALKMRPELDKADGDIWHALNNQNKPYKQYELMYGWMQEHGVPDVDIPELLKNLRDRIDELELDIAPFLKGNQQLLDQLQGLLDQGNPALGLRGDVIDTDNDGVGDATEITLGTDPLHNNGNEGFIKLDSPDDHESFDIATDKSIDFSFEPLDTDVKLTYSLVLDAGGKESVRHNAKDTERFDMASLIGPQGLFTDVIGPGGVLTVSWHVEAQLPASLSRAGGKVPQIRSATRTFTIQTPSNQLVEVNLAAAAASTKLGSPVLVNGTITDVTGLNDWEIVINYDPALLTFSQGVKRGLFSKSTVFFNDSRGQLTVSGSIPKGSAGITGNGDIFQLTFTPVLPGRSEVAVKRVTLHDVLGKPIQAQGGDIADVGVTASSTGTGGGGVTPQLPPAPGVTTSPQSSGDSAGLPSLGPLMLVSPRSGDSLDYPGGKELSFEYTELHTKFDVTYTLYMNAGGAQATKRNYVSGDPMPLATLLSKNGPFANSMGPNGLDIDWHIEASVDTGGTPIKIQSETRRISIKLPTNKSVTLDINGARGKSRGIAVGDSVFVRGTLSSVNALGEWQMTVSFDSSVLSFVSGRKMGMFATGNVRIDSQGMGRVVISGTSPGAGLSGDGDCFELEFTAKGDGTCTIEADAPKLTDAMGRSIPGNAGSSVDVDVVAKGGGNTGGNSGTTGKP